MKTATFQGLGSICKCMFPEHKGHSCTVMNSYHFRRLHSAGLRKRLGCSFETLYEGCLLGLNELTGGLKTRWTMWRAGISKTERLPSPQLPGQLSEGNKPRGEYNPTTGPEIVRSFGKKAARTDQKRSLGGGSYNPMLTEVCDQSTFPSARTGPPLIYTHLHSVHYTWQIPKDAADAVGLRAPDLPTNAGHVHSQRWLQPCKHSDRRCLAI